MVSITQKAAAGNQEALAALYEANKHKVYCLSRELVRNTRIASEVSAQALQFALQIFKNKDNLPRRKVVVL